MNLPEKLEINRDHEITAPLREKINEIIDYLAEMRLGITDLPEQPVSD